MTRTVAKSESLGAIRQSLISAIKLLHTLIVVFVVFGWTVPWPKLLAFHAVFVLGMKLHWKLANGCILTVMEMRLRGEPLPTSERDSPFIESLFKAVHLRVPRKETLARIINIVVWTSFAISATRALIWYV